MELWQYFDFMRVRTPTLYWKFSELSFESSEELLETYNKLRESGHNPVVRQTDEKILKKFLATIAYRKIRLSKLAQQSLESYNNTGVGIGKSYYYVEGTNISYKLAGSDWDIIGDVGYNTYKEASVERNKNLAEIRWGKKMRHKFNVPK
jgi:hypothetical protein